VQKIMLDINVDQCPATAVTATVLYSHARAATKRELLEATATVASLQGCKQAYRLAKRQLLVAEGALEFVKFLQQQPQHEVRALSLCGCTYESGVKSASGGKSEIHEEIRCLYV
jgi:hypothetical protein